METTKTKRVYSKSILEIGNGRLLELADHELVKVLANIADPNTNWKNVRKMSFEMKFKPNEERSQIEVEISAKTSLVANKPSKVTLYSTPFKDPATGEVKTVLKEVTAVAPGQANLFNGDIVEPQVFLIGKREVEPEVFESANENKQIEEIETVN